MSTAQQIDAAWLEQLLATLRGDWGLDDEDLKGLIAALEELTTLRAAPAATALDTPAQPAPIDLHNAIMNIQCKPAPGSDVSCMMSYKIGHRDARHAAAELASAAKTEAALDDEAWVHSELVHQREMIEKLIDSPAVRQPLTDEQLNECLQHVNLAWPRKIARAIEAAHGITGEKV